MVTSNRLSYHYEKILRDDLLLKLNYNNVMELPRLQQIKILSEVPLNALKNVSLALQILCGQKPAENYEVASAKGHNNLNNFKKFSPISMKKNRLHFLKQRGSNNLKYQIRVSLRSDTMYHFLDKLICLCNLGTFYDYPFQIQSNTVQFSLGSSELRLFPEIQNHFEFFDSLQNLRIVLVTSALSEKETQLLWTGFLQKENLLYG